MEKNLISILEFERTYQLFKNHNLYGRYLHNGHIFAELKNLTNAFTVIEEGDSVNGNKIVSVEIGTGPIKILGWSQMHGNETTTTKAVFDIFNFLKEKNETVETLLEACTIKIIPILNPDGAFVYTRENANNVDLNRDACNLQEPESIVLNKIFKSFRPNFCLNLHDQRTIYSAGETENPATLSFLAPSMDENRSVTQTRKIAMQIIAGIEKDISPFLKDKIGRYDDAFNKNCTGDSFTSLGIPTILFEAGHFPKDYLREETRKFTAMAIFSALKHIALNTYSKIDFKDYFSIPENQKLYYDIVIRDAKVENKLLEYGIQYTEILKEGKIHFEPVVEEISDRIKKFGHREIKAEHRKVTSITGNCFILNEQVPEFLIDGELLLLNPQ